jgi:hypothetical protein
MQSVNFACARGQRRDYSNEEYFAAVGFDKAAQPIEMVAVQLAGDGWFIYHARTPPTKVF